MPQHAERCPVEFLEGSYLAQLGQGDGVWAAVRPHIPGGLVARLRECVFVMIKPDAIQSSRHHVLLAGLAAAGFRLVHAQATLSAVQRHFEELYQYNLTVRNEQNMMCAWWINARLYAMSPSLALLYWVPPIPGVTAHQQVNRLKGSSNPFLGSPGELRWNARGTNLSLNLLHSADDPVSSAREFLIFGSPSQLSAALQRADELATAKPGATSLPEEVLHEQLYLAGPAHRRLDLPSVLLGIKSRLRATEPSGVLHQETGELYRLYRELAADDSDIVSRWARYCELCADEKAILDRLAWTPGRDRGEFDLLRHLATPKEYRFETSERIRAELLRRRITLDPWDQLALDTSLYYHALLP